MFWLLCIPTRIAVAWTAKVGSREVTDVMRAAALIPAGVWLSGMLDDKVVGEAGGKVWWGDVRPLHGALYGFFALTGDYRSLVFDVFLGAGTWFGANT
jgi:hypothetical protein